MDEIEPSTAVINERQAAWYIAGPRLDLTLTVTGKCNFRCTYCYEDFSQGRMSPEVRHRVKALLDRRAPQLKELILQFFGGEPLVASDVVLELASHGMALARRHGLFYRAGMSTNGSLLGLDLAARLSDVGVRHFQISLDGPGPCHDRTRVRADGSASFDQIWSNLLRLRESDLPLQIRLRCHVTGENSDDWLAFASNLRPLLEDERFGAYVEGVAPLGGPNDKEFLFPDSRQVAAVRDALGVTPSPIRPCYAGVPTAWVVTPRGGLSRCTVIGDERNQIGRLTDDGRMLIDQERLRPWFEAWNGKPELLGCPLMGISKGKKPKATTPFIGANAG